MTQRLIPRATYRIQFTKDFGFLAAAQLAPYLADLGISHVYASPYLRARPGSTHGYDIVSHVELNPELGSDADFYVMADAFRKNGLGQILDFVPNHMGVGGADNPLWLDVLEWGPLSESAGWFDIDWRTDHSYLRDKLLVPFLGEQYGRSLEAGALELTFDSSQGTFSVWAYGSHKLPIRPVDYGIVIGDGIPELEKLSDSFANLGPQTPRVVDRADELKDQLRDLALTSSEARSALDDRLVLFRGIKGRLETWTRLHSLIAAQNWRAAHFRVASDVINYRRFFNVSDLAGIRMEIPEVFDHAHSLVFKLLEEGVIDGLRLDHIDGLLDPKQYCRRLREKAPKPFYLLVEKILAPHEKLRDDWNADGATGYEVTNLLTGLLINPSGEKRLTNFYHEFTGFRTEFSEMTRLAKLEIIDDEMASELSVLAREAGRLARSNPNTADFTDGLIRRALRQIVACFPVYRTYIDTSSISEVDRRELDFAFSRASKHERGLDATVFDFLHQLLTSDIVALPKSGFSRTAVFRIAMRMQQYTGPVMAKGLEDTAFYRYNRLLALNEVGGQPDRFGYSIAAFHQANIDRIKTYPHTLLTTSTHDTKRGEDARARVAVISALPEEWERHVKLWSRVLRAPSDQPIIDPNDEYAFYQTLIGSWPASLCDRAVLSVESLGSFRARVEKTMLKLIREAKVYTRWSNPDREYEELVSRFVARALDASGSNDFLDSFVPWMAEVARLGSANSLIQLVLKMTIPGVPDIYQGAETWDFSMVDPDNRRPVDFVQNRRLSETRAGFSDMIRNWQSPGIKLFVTKRILDLRKEKPYLFSEGSYLPLSDLKMDRICAFVREHSSASILVAVLLPGALENLVDSRFSDLLNGRWKSILTEQTMQEGFHVGDLFQEAPFNVLLKV